MRVAWTEVVPGARMRTFPSFAAWPNPALVGTNLVIALFSEKEVRSYCLQSREWAWSYPLGYLGPAAVVPWGDLVLAKTSQSIVALVAETGERAWEYCPYGAKGEHLYAQPTILGKTALFGDRRGRVHCLDLETGDLRWRQQVAEADGDDINVCGLIHENLFLAACNAGYLFALNGITGDPVWVSEVDTACSRQPVRTGEDIAFLTGHTLISVDPASGAVLRMKALDGASHWDLVSTGDAAIVSSWLDAPEEIWSDPVRVMTEGALLQRIPVQGEPTQCGLPVSAMVVKPLDSLDAIFIGTSIGYQLRDPRTLEVVFEEVDPEFERDDVLISPGRPVEQDGVLYCVGMLGRRTEQIVLQALELKS